MPASRDSPLPASDFGGMQRVLGGRMPQLDALRAFAILAVILVYWQKIRSTIAALPTDSEARRFAGNVAIAFVPAVVFRLLLGKTIQAHLFRPWFVATTFILGGFIILWAERRTPADCQS